MTESLIFKNREEITKDGDLEKMWAENYSDIKNFAANLNDLVKKLQ